MKNRKGEEIEMSKLVLEASDYLMRCTSWNENRVTKALTNGESSHAKLGFQSLSQLVIKVEALQGIANHMKIALRWPINKGIKNDL